MTARAADLDRAPALLAASGSAIGVPLHVLMSTGSTNDDAKRAAKAGAPHGAVWVADEQLQGRGRQGRAWIGAPGESLLFSALLRIACPPARLPLLALAAGLAIRDAVAAAAPRAAVCIKWPNDVLADGKKIAGILVESSMSGGAVAAVIVGVGLNVHALDFPIEIADRATSLAALLRAGDPPPDRAALLVSALSRIGLLLPLVAARGLSPIHSRLESADALAGLEVTSELGAGRAAGIDVDGRLVVRAEDGTLHRWSAGEVHIGRIPRDP